jgi:hypothetical protein
MRANEIVENKSASSTLENLLARQRKVKLAIEPLKILKYVV